jgi:hypothetical protein
LGYGEFICEFSKVTTMSTINIFLLFTSSTLAAQAFFETAVATNTSNNNEVAVNDALAQVTSVNAQVLAAPNRGSSADIGN